MELKEVFGPIINFIKSLQKKEHENSKVAAKERLKLVLMQDRASVSPDFFEMMKKEIIEVIKKYIEIDEETLEVQLTRGFEDGLEGPALYANIPIKSIKPVAKKPIEKKEEEQEEQEEQVSIENIEESTKEENIDEVVSTLEETEKTEEKNEDFKETEEEILSEIYEEPEKVEETKEQKETQNTEVKQGNTNEKSRKKNRTRR